jgi:hypothetical protein
VSAVAYFPHKIGGSAQIDKKSEKKSHSHFSYSGMDSEPSRSLSAVRLHVENGAVVASAFAQHI